MNLMLERAVANLKKMPMTEKIQLLVEAGLMTPEDADQAKHRLAGNDGPVGVAGEPDRHSQAPRRSSASNVLPKARRLPSYSISI
jgi:hypothetical protein